jgi:hypothetical protein
MSGARQRRGAAVPRPAVPPTPTACIAIRPLKATVRTEWYIRPMPPLADVPNVLRYILTYTVGEDVDITTRLHFRYTGGPPSVTDCISLATDAAAHWVSFLEAMTATTTTLTEVRVTDLTSATSSDGVLAVSHNGTRSGSFLPAGACALTNYEIARRYRGGKPRSYNPFGVQGDMNDGQKWNTSFTGALTTAYLDFTAAILGDTAGTTTLNAFVSVSYYDGFTAVENPITHRYRNVPTPRAVPQVDVINGIVAAAKIAYQRRRSVR